MTDTIKPALTPEQWAMDGTTEPVLLNGKDATRRVYFREPEQSTYTSGRPFMVDEGFGVELNADHSLSVWDDSWGITVAADIRHGVAALCLYGQPFGFTAEDVEAVRAGVLALDESGCELLANELRTVAAKLDALLPK